jgi:hypothetical protein
MAKRKSSSWDNRFYVRVYELRRSGYTNKKAVAEVLGVTALTLDNWLRTDDALKDAWDSGAQKRSESGADGATLRSFVYDRMPPHLQSLWDKIEACDNNTQGTLRLAEIIGGASKESQQRLYLYALVNCGWNASEARKKCGLPLSVIKGWVETDPDFSEMVDEIDAAKKDYFENALVDLVSARDTSATIFANKTFNRDRGYGESRKVEVSGTIEHQHHVLSVDSLELPLEVRRAILDAYREVAASQGVPLVGHVVEAQLHGVV